MEMVNVVVIQWQGLIEDVLVFKNEADAFSHFKEATGVSYEDFKERSKDEDSENILTNYAGSNIWELKIK